MPATVNSSGVLVLPLSATNFTVKSWVSRRVLHGEDRQHGRAEDEPGVDAAQAHHVRALAHQPDGHGHHRAERGHEAEHVAGCPQGEVHGWVDAPDRAGVVVVVVFGATLPPFSACLSRAPFLAV